MLIKLNFNQTREKGITHHNNEEHDEIGKIGNKFH